MRKTYPKFATLCTVSEDIELHPERLVVGRNEYGIPTNLHFRGNGYYFEWEHHCGNRSTIRLQQMGICMIFKLEDCVPYAKEFREIIHYLLPKEFESLKIAIMFIREAIINALALEKSGAIIFKNASRMTCACATFWTKSGLLPRYKLRF
ncbi:MAG TPA: hypothetical protein PKD34_03210, partial [Candidatus Doudnabacteria bacterium]|nr:hypothetical protein [Candidatus Doudnabacteria bacterium]